MPLLLLFGLGAAVLLLAGKGGGGAPSTAPLHLPPAQVQNAVSTCPAMDPGIPQRLGTAVCVALARETSAPTLRDFASALQPKYPVAANLLVQKANRLAGRP